MMKFKKILIASLATVALISSLGFTWPFAWIFSGPNLEQFGTNAWLQREFQILKPQAGNISDKVLKLSLIAYLNAEKQGYTNKQVMTVIDYSLPSTEKRLWVFDLRRGRTLFNTWVSHGKNSGGINATSFSNNSGSLKSSIGVFVTANTYNGKNGYSLRIRGLERGVNDSAYQRAVVIHGAPYTSADNIRKYGLIGRSWGCPAVSAELAKPIINTIKDDSLIFAYYPDRHWLSSSRFLV